MKNLASMTSIAALAFASTPPAATKPATKRVEPVMTGVSSAIAMPVKSTKRGSATLYPFATLTAAGQCFGVKNKTALNMSSIVSNANRKNLVPMKDEAGNTVYNTKELTAPDGTVTTVPDASSPKMVAGKHFFAFDVNAEYKAKIKGTELEGSTVLVFRDI